MLVLPKAPGLSEYSIQSALASYFGWDQHLCFPRVQMWLWEQDFVVITKAMKVWEVEIKTSMTDWKNDLKKDKWESQNWKKVSRFYYCVTSELLVNGIPDWVPDYAGVLEVREVVLTKNETKVPGKRVQIRIRREAQNRSTFKISERWLMKLFKSTYFRFWRSQRHDPMSEVFVQAEEPPQLIAP